MGNGSIARARQQGGDVRPAFPVGGVGGFQHGLLQQRVADQVLERFRVTGQLGASLRVGTRYERADLAESHLVIAAYGDDGVWGGGQEQNDKKKSLPF